MGLGSRFLPRLAAAAAAALLWAAPPLGAQEVDRIAAVVNDEIISVQDVEMRTRMAILMAGLPDSIDARRRVVPQVLRKMIDERLQVQEASRLKVSLSPNEMENAIAGVEKNNRMQRGQLLSQLEKVGIDPEAVKGQIRADVTWMKLASRILLPTVKIGEEEISERLDLIKSRQGRPEYLLSEIFLAVDTPRQEEEARRLADRLLEQIKAGTPFPALASQFSQSATAANGGGMGWVSEVGMDEEMLAVAARMQPGTVSGVVRTGAGYIILAMADKRIAGASSRGDTILDLAQVLFPVPPRDAPPRAVLAQRASEMAREAKTCAAIEELGKKVYPEKSGRIGKVRMSELPAAIRKGVGDLPMGAISQPVDVPEGILIIMVCGREVQEAKVEEPSREAVRRNIEDERVEMMQRRYLRDLRRAAFIDVRM